MMVDSVINEYASQASRSNEASELIKFGFRSFSPVLPDMTEEEIATASETYEGAYKQSKDDARACYMAGAYLATRKVVDVDRELFKDIYQQTSYFSREDLKTYDLQINIPIAINVKMESEDPCWVQQGVVEKDDKVFLHGVCFVYDQEYIRLVSWVKTKKDYRGVYTAEVSKNFDFTNNCEPLRIIKATIMCLLTSNLDMEKKQIHERSRKMSPIRKRLRESPGLSVTRITSKDYKTREREGGGTVDFRKAHYRIGHFHTFRTGKGRKEKIIKWVAPTYVRATKLDE
jgi:hypothetical protein